MSERLNTRRFNTFVTAVEHALDNTRGEGAILDAVDAALRNLVAVDDWLPPSHACPGDPYYRQYLLHLDPARQFSVVSFVWGLGQSTPIHDHTTWGVIGMLRGCERAQAYRTTATGLEVVGKEEELWPGMTSRVSPSIGDIHRVRNGTGEISISIHVYGADIGTTRRHVYDASTGRTKEFVSGYSPSGSRV